MTDPPGNHGGGPPEPTDDEVVEVSEGTVRVPASRDADGVVSWMEVPREWYEHTREASEVNDKFKDRYLDLPGVRSIGLTRSERTYGGKPGLKLSVAVDPASDAVEKLPDEFRGLGVEVEEREAGEFL